ncbi:MAG: NADPH-dependent F420 reductase [Hyphomicrobiaceae bacterium]|nr:NADPH-dependent F420 reductase [Hyphomicrobiaceae bacterium]
MTDTRPTLAIIGGTGALGSGLARRWAKAGYAVVIGSRTPEKAAATAGELAAVASGPAPRGANVAEAARIGDVVVVTVPFASVPATLDEIRPFVAGKLVVDTTVPLVPPRVARVQMPSEGSAAIAAQARLGAEARVVAAFQNVAAHKLQKDDEIACDVLVCGDKAEDREAVIALAGAAGLRGLHAGPLANAVAAEALTSILIGINRTYKVDGAGVRITGF